MLCKKEKKNTSPAKLRLNKAKLFLPSTLKGAIAARKRKVLL